MHGHRRPLILRVKLLQRVGDFHDGPHQRGEQDENVNYVGDPFDECDGAIKPL